MAWGGKLIYNWIMVSLSMHRLLCKLPLISKTTVQQKTSAQVTGAEAYRIKWYYICLTKRLSDSSKSIPNRAEAIQQAIFCKKGKTKSRIKGWDADRLLCGFYSFFR